MGYRGRTRANPGDPFWTVQEAADELDVHPSSVYKWIRRGWLKANEDKLTGQLLIRDRDLRDFEQEDGDQE